MKKGSFKNWERRRQKMSEEINNEVEGKPLNKELVLSKNPIAYPLALIRIDQNWFLVKPIIQKSSLAKTVRMALKRITTNKLCDFLLIFGLTIQDLFIDNPADTADFIGQICQELVQVIKTKKGLHPHTLRNLKEWLNSLKLRSTGQLRQLLQETIATLENLPETEDEPALKPVKKMASSRYGN